MAESDIEKRKLSPGNTEADEAFKRAALLNQAVIKSAVNDILSIERGRSEYENYLDAIYFLFAGEDVTVREMKHRRTFEAYCERAGLDPKTMRVMVWRQLTPSRQNIIRADLVEFFNIVLDSDFTTS